MTRGSKAPDQEIRAAAGRLFPYYDSNSMMVPTSGRFSLITQNPAHDFNRWATENARRLPRQDLRSSLVMID